MSTPIPAGSNVGLQSSQTSAEILKCDCIQDSPEAILLSFKDILSDETMLSKLLEDLKDLLPAEELSKLEDLVESGNDLPFAAIISPDSPLYNLLFNGEIVDIPKVIQQDAAQISPFASPTIKLSEDLIKQGATTIKRHIAEVVNLIDSNGEGGTEGKQMHDLLVSAKTDLAVTDLVPKILTTSAVGSDSSTVQTANINSAISGLAQLSNFQTSGGSSAPPAIAAPLGEEGWGQAMGERIMWMIGKGVQSSSIRINPPNLGPIQVHVSVHNDQTSVNILAQHGVVKDALEAAIPRLREMLHESNLQLVNVDVSHRENMQQDNRSAMFQQDQRESSNYFMQQEQTLASTAEEEMPRHYISSGLLDDYA